MPVTVRFDPTSNSQQAVVIPSATAKNDGVMTKVQAAKLDLLGPTIWDTLIPPSDVTTEDAVAVTATVFDLNKDGVIALITNVVAASPDGSLWACWLTAESIYTRINGVVTLQNATDPDPIIDSGGAAHTWQLLFDTDGTHLRIMVQGSAAQRVKWSLHAAGNYNPIP